MKKFTEYLIENNREEYDYSCAMLYFDIDLNEIQTQIEDEDLHEYGLEDDPHVTLLYGLHDNEIKYYDVIDLILESDMEEITLNNISLFENEDFDVVKFDIEDCEYLYDINKKICEEFPYTTDYPDYHPHSTIAYVKKGMGSKYVDLFKGEEVKVKPNMIVYSRANGDKVKYEFKN